MAVVADGALDEREREVLDRLVAALVDEYGADLDAVWLMAHARVASGPCTAPTRTPHDDTSLGVPRRSCPGLLSVRRLPAEGVSLLGGRQLKWARPAVVATSPTVRSRAAR